MLSKILSRVLLATYIIMNADLHLLIACLAETARCRRIYMTLPGTTISVSTSFFVPHKTATRLPGNLAAVDSLITC